ncbi:MAG: hypothetical protein CVT84_14030 [Alphaproteobacteria bacterium HGW-Alphaproteobacteria-6]|nr:MAG: hypothetical protein CVT84_14030 [Alphaproteobacteria bacterium HGW-Alphaproteobacteria-6]
MRQAVSPITNQAMTKSSAKRSTAAAAPASARNGRPVKATPARIASVTAVPIAAKRPARRSRPSRISRMWRTVTRSAPNRPAAAALTARMNPASAISTASAADSTGSDPDNAAQNAPASADTGRKITEKARIGPGYRHVIGIRGLSGWHVRPLVWPPMVARR